MRMSVDRDAGRGYRSRATSDRAGVHAILKVVP